MLGILGNYGAASVNFLLTKRKKREKYYPIGGAMRMAELPQAIA